MTSRISCDRHDYFEIVCMRQSTVSITVANGVTYHGTAINLTTRKGAEWIEIQLTSGEVKHINLTDVTKLSASGNQLSNHNFDIVF